MPKLKESLRSSETPFETYLHEINEVPLLDAAKEIELAGKIAQGDMEAREHMIRANLRLVVKLARKYVNHGLPLEDLIEEGNIGLMTAVEKFDPAFKTKFSTYASYWIMQNIKRAILNTASAIRIPAYMQENISKWRKLMAEYRQRSIDPKPRYVMKRLGISRKQYGLLMETVTGLDRQTTEGTRANDEFSLEEMVVDTIGDDPADIVADWDEVDVLHGKLKEMDDREATVLQLSYGFDRDIGEQTLKEIGEALGHTRERVRQIEAKGEENLRRRMRRPGA